MDCLVNFVDKLPRFDKCCCYFSIETGSLIIAYVSLLIYIISGISSLSLLISGSAAGSSIFKLIITVILAFLTVYLLIGIKRKDSAKLFVWIIISLLVVIVNIVSLILSIAFSVFLILSAGIIEILWEIYCILIINSLYKDLQG